MKKDEAQLRDEIALREASIADVRREVASGELTSAEAIAIEERETTGLEMARARLSLLASTGSVQAAKRRRRKWLLIVALACFLAAAIVLLWSSLSTRQAGNSITGSVQLGRQQQIEQFLTEAQSDEAENNTVAALAAYQQVLGLDAKNITALTETGWLEFSAGSSNTNPALVKIGLTDLKKAIAYGPNYPAPRLYYGIAAYSTPGNTKIAIKELKIFLALKPTKAQLAVAEPVLKALKLPTT